MTKKKHTPIYYPMSQKNECRLPKKNEFQRKMDVKNSISVTFATKKLPEYCKSLLRANKTVMI